MGADQIPEQVYLDAARAVAELDPWYRHDGALEALVAYDQFRAAVASAYRAGQAAPTGPLPDGAEIKYGIQWTEPGGHVFVSMRTSLQEARDEVAANVGHPQLLNMTVVQSWRTPWVPLTDATPADGQDGDGHG